jgi:hypothetical protein
LARKLPSSVVSGIPKPIQALRFRDLPFPGQENPGGSILVFLFGAKESARSSEHLDNCAPGSVGRAEESFAEKDHHARLFQGSTDKVQ